MRSYRLQRRHAREEGAAMLVVMLVLLMTTATAIYGMHATTFEMQAAGHARRAAQTEEIARAGLTTTAAYYSRLGGLTIDPALQGEGLPLTLEPFEPNPLPGRVVARKYQSDFDLFFSGPESAPVLETQSAIGPRQAWDAGILVDIIPLGRTNTARAGQDIRDSGSSVVVTARGRVRLGTFEATTDVTSDVENDRPWHESAVDSRAILRTPSEP